MLKLQVPGKGMSLIDYITKLREEKCCEDAEESP